MGPVLCCSHGVGMSTMSVILHELLKLVHYAKCKDPIFIRIGTSGGIGVDPGTVVVTHDAYNGYLRNEHEIVSTYAHIISIHTYRLNEWVGMVAINDVSTNFYITFLENYKHSLSF